MRLQTGDGVSLEAIDDRPPGAPRGGIVLCHPHPQMGGSMRAPFLDTVAAVLCDQGWRVLRFNTRGTDGSEGTFGGGVAEAADLAAAWDALDTEPRGLAGWSFGARLAMGHAAVSGAPTVLFAPPLGEGHGGLPPQARPAGPVLAVIGDRDKFVSAEAIEEYLGQPPVILRGCDHFFIGGFATKAADLAAQFFALELGGEPSP